MEKQTPCGSPMQMIVRNLSKGHKKVSETKELSKGSCTKK